MRKKRDEHVWLERITAEVSERLPEYMVPLGWVVLAQLPQTATGKIDRRALANREDETRRTEAERIAPATGWEERLLAVWQKILETDRIGVTDNFFAVGGHSLKATRIVSQIRKEYEIEMPLRLIFEEPTIRRLAVEVEQIAAAHGTTTTIEKAARPTTGLPLSFAQQRLWFLQKLFPDNTAYNLVTAVRLTGELDRTALARSWSAVVARQESLRTRFIERDGEARQIVAEPHAVKLTAERQPAQSSEAEWIKAVIAEEENHRYDLAQAPLYRLRYLAISASEQVLVLGMHHIISDGWSMGILMEQVAEAYQRYADKDQFDRDQARLV